MDHMMPEMDGVETVRRIRDMGGKYEGLTIVALTANAMKDSRELFFNNSFNGFLAKPINTNELREIIVTHLPNEKVIMGAAGAQATAGMEDKIMRQSIVTFVKDNGDTFAKINDALAAGDVKTAHRIAHTLKSAAGFFGKTALQEAAASLEHSLQTQPRGYTPVQLKDIEAGLADALDEFAYLVAEEEANKQEAVAINPDEWVSLLSEIKPFLLRSDFAVTKYSERLEGIAGMEELAVLIEDYDFDGALELIDRLLSSYPSPHNPA
jgi:HPt (histidine-containing phosphotransfer) domain-containing protein